MKKVNKIFCILSAVVFCSCIKNGQNIIQKLKNEKAAKNVYVEIWNGNKKEMKNGTLDYNGFWREYQQKMFSAGNINFRMYNIIYNYSANKYFICFIDDGYYKKGPNSNVDKYIWNVRFSVIEEKNTITNYEKYGAGLTGVSEGIPLNYIKKFADIIKLKSGDYMKSYYEFSDTFGPLEDEVYSDFKKIFPLINRGESINEYFKKQFPDKIADDNISVSPVEGLWYLAADNSPASEEAFMNTRAIIVIGKDEKLNPGWYHVVLYYDSGDKDKGWICEWGAAEIAERELYVQLSSMSEGNPFTVKLNEKNGRKWLSINHSVSSIKTGQFVRILPLK